MDVSTINTVVTGLFGLAGVLFTLKWGMKQKLRAEDSEEENKDQKERDLFTYQVVRPLVTMPEWAETSAKIDFHVRSQDKDAQRILLFVCVNGKQDPKTTTAIWQWRSDASGFQAYIDVDLTKAHDNGDYVARLRDTRKNGRHRLNKETVPDSIIGDVMIQEDINDSVWYWIGSVPSPETDQVAGVYLSASALGDDFVGSKEEIEIQNLVWEIFKPVAKAYAKHGYKMEH